MMRRVLGIVKPRLPCFLHRGPLRTAGQQADREDDYRRTRFEMRHLNFTGHVVTSAFLIHHARSTRTDHRNPRRRILANIGSGENWKATRTWTNFREFLCYTKRVTNHVFISYASEDRHLAEAVDRDGGERHAQAKAGLFGTGKY